MFLKPGQRKLVDKELVDNLVDTFCLQETPVAALVDILGDSVS